MPAATLTTQLPLAITGASGHLGALVAEALAARIGGNHDVTLASRDPEKLRAHATRGFRTARADFDDPASLAMAFESARTVLVISGDAPCEARLQQHRRAIEAAKRTGVTRVVYTSAVNPSADSRFPFAEVHGETEDYLRASGLAYTIVRDGSYAETLAGPLARSRDTGVLALPGAAGRVAYVTRRDVAEVLARVLLEDRHTNRTYTLTGPEAVSLADVAKALGDARRRPVTAREIAPAAHAAALAEAGVPAYVVEADLGLRAAAAAGEYDFTTHDVASILGRPATPLSTWIRDYV